MSDATVSDVDPSDLVAVLEQQTQWAVIIGAAQPGQSFPFVACWPVTPQRVGESLASEDAGQIVDVWQINCFGATVSQAKAVRDAVLNLVWPTGWELVNVGPMIEDTADAPTAWFVPVDYRHIGQRTL